MADTGVDAEKKLKPFRWVTGYKIYVRMSKYVYMHLARIGCMTAKISLCCNPAGVRTKKVTYKYICLRSRKLTFFQIKG